MTSRVLSVVPTEEPPVPTRCRGLYPTKFTQTSHPAIASEHLVDVHDKLQMSQQHPTRGRGQSLKPSHPTIADEPPESIPTRGRRRPRQRKAVQTREADKAVKVVTYESLSPPSL